MHGHLGLIVNSCVKHPNSSFLLTMLRVCKSSNLELQSVMLLLPLLWDVCAYACLRANAKAYQAQVPPGATTSNATFQDFLCPPRKKCQPDTKNYDEHFLVTYPKNGNFTFTELPPPLPPSFWPVPRLNLALLSPFFSNLTVFDVHLNFFPEMPSLRKCRPGRLAPSAPLGTPLGKWNMNEPLIW